METINLDSIKRRMLIKYPFFGSLVAHLTYIEDNSINTAATDGENIYYNSKFVSGLTNDEQIFLFAHEVCHVAFNHILRSENKDQKLWNTATDAVINSFLRKDKLPMINGGVCEETLKKIGYKIFDLLKYNCEELYDELLKQKRSNPNLDNANEQSDRKGSNSSDVGHDTHKLWEEGIKKSKQKNTTREKDDKIKKQQEKISKMGEKDAFKKNEQIRKAQLEDMYDKLSKESTNSTPVNRKADNIGFSKPIIDWRLALREAINAFVDWSYQNAEIENGVLTPKIEEFPISETEILIDTSGSVSKTLIRNFLKECKNILKTSNIKIGCFDDKFYGFNEIKTFEDIDNMPTPGGNGTDFNLAVNTFSKRTENKIIFTDGGEGGAIMPKANVNVIWIVYGGKKINPQGGRVIYISNEQLRRLTNFELDEVDKKVR